MIGRKDDYLRIQNELEQLNDLEKINYLRYDLPEWVDYNIYYTNDDIYIHIGYDECEDSIGVNFDKFGYGLLPTLFSLLGLKSDFV